jgi:hypothetical protein
MGRRKVATPARVKRTEFIRTAFEEAIRKREYADIREAYRKQPDAASDCDSWSNCEKFEERPSCARMHKAEPYAI